MRKKGKAGTYALFGIKTGTLAFCIIPPLVYRGHACDKHTHTHTHTHREKERIGIPDVNECKSVGFWIMSFPVFTRLVPTFFLFLTFYYC